MRKGTTRTVLILSDLFWSKSSKEVNLKDLQMIKIKNKIPNTKRFSSINEYVNLISINKPDTILFAGDLTGDGSCGHGFHFAFLCLLQFLENNKINSVFVRGNHDLHEYYSIVEKYCEDLKFTQEISGKLVKVNELKIVGLSYYDTKDKLRLKEIISRNYKVDFVLAHAELFRRSWLFDFDAKFIVTGHYDYKFNNISNKIFLSFFNDGDHLSYSVINIQNETETITYFLHFNSCNSIKISANKKNGEFSFLPIKNEETNPTLLKHHKLFLKDLIGTEFKNGLEFLLNFKFNYSRSNLKLDQNTFKRLTKLEVNFSKKFSKTLIIDYLGKSLIEKQH